MPGGLNDILPDHISEENEEVLLELMKQKMKSAAGLTVTLLRAMEERFGPEVQEVVRDMSKSHRLTPRTDTGEPKADLRDFCADLEKGCVGSHRWEQVINEPGRRGYHFTRCMWAEIFREFGEPELGFAICAGDKPAVESYNPKLAFKRTKVLMNGDEICDHIFYVKR